MKKWTRQAGDELGKAQAAHGLNFEVVELRLSDRFSSQAEIFIMVKKLYHNYIFYLHFILKRFLGWSNLDLVIQD